VVDSRPHTLLLAQSLQLSSPPTSLLLPPALRLPLPTRSRRSGRLENLTSGGGGLRTTSAVDLKRVRANITNNGLTGKGEI